MRLNERQIRELVRQEMEDDILEEGAMDWLQGGLDIVGLVPGIGEAADGLNAIVSLGRGNPLEAILSGISMIPAAGDAVGKGGKLVLKLLDPVMDMIKAGDKAADIIKKIGPEKIKKAKAILELVKDTIVKYKPKIQAGFEAVKKADLAAVEELIGVKIPGPAKGKAEELLKKAAGSLDQDGMAKVFDFLSNLALGEDDESGEGEGKEGGEEKLAASYNPRGYLLSENATLLGHVMGDEYINQQLKEMADHIKNLK
jgi:hypothetical protein